GPYRKTRPGILPEPSRGPALSAGLVGLSRRRFLVAAGSGAAAGLGYALGFETRRFLVTRRTVSLRGLPRALDGLRSVQITDIHHGPWLSLDYVRQVVRTANELRPDLILLTGDFVDGPAAYARPLAEELARLQPRIGSVAVLGNHDWH